MRDSVGFGIKAGDMCGSKDNVPQEEHIAEVALVIADAVIRGGSMMRVMRSRRGDCPFQDPGNRMKYLVLVEGSVPRHARVRSDCDDRLDRQYGGRGGPQTEIDKNARH